MSETERLSRLVNQVLDLAKIESGHVDWQADELDLAEVIEQAAISVGQLLEEGGQRLELDLEQGGGARVRADRDRLMQVMVNLLSNAAKFSPQGTGHIRVVMAAVAAGWRVSVSDNGPGIPVAELDWVFEKFHQSNAGGKKPLGTGLGLPICKEIIAHFDGRIWAEAPASGGACILFELPALPRAAPVT